MTGGRRSIVGRIDLFCSRLNDGLTAVAIALAIILSLMVALRTTQTLQVPKGFEIAATT